MYHSFFILSSITGHLGCFLIFSLCPVTLLSSLISSGKLWGESSGLSMYSIMAPANNDSFTSSFPIPPEDFNHTHSNSFQKHFLLFKKSLSSPQYSSPYLACFLCSRQSNMSFLRRVAVSPVQRCVPSTQNSSWFRGPTQETFVDRFLSLTVWVHFGRVYSIHGIIVISYTI